MLQQGQEDPPVLGREGGQQFVLGLGDPRVHFGEEPPALLGRHDAPRPAVGRVLLALQQIASSNLSSR